MKILAIILARGDSKGIPGKNLISINGTPLLYYTVTACLNSALVNRVVVSTNDEEISRVAKQIGAEVVRRPKKLSGDLSPVDPALEHVLDYLKNKEIQAP